MIIAVTANGETLDAPVSRSLPRCRMLVFFDTDLGVIVDVVDNPEREIPDGGGLEAAQVIVGHDAEVLLTGEIDAEAGDILGFGGVEHQVCTDGTVQSALDRCLAGDLPLSPAPSRGIHPGPGTPDWPHAREATPGSDPGRETTDEEVVGHEVECVCLSCGYTLKHETGSTACEDIPCPRCGTNMSSHDYTE